MIIDETQDDTLVTESEETVAEESATEDVELEESQEATTDWEKEAKKWEAIAKRHAKKEAKEEPAPAISTNLDAKDFLALTESKVSSADFDEVRDFANYKKMSISEALKNPTLKALLKERSEERATAQATEIKSPRAGVKRDSAEDVLRRAEHQGRIPESDEDISAVFQARQARRFANYKKK